MKESGTRTNNYRSHRSHWSYGSHSFSAFTLIELLIVVLLIAILTAIAVPNFLEAQERSLRAADAANLKALGTALHTYTLDYGKLPPTDKVAGPFSSPSQSVVRNGPAAGGSQDGVPWVLVDLKYVTAWETLFCPKYLRLYKSGMTVGGGNYPRYHNFRYCYNTNAFGSALSVGRTTDPTNASKWLLRDLYLPADKGFYRDAYPQPPADYKFPWGDNHDVEYVLYMDTSVKLVKGGTDTPPADLPNP